MEPNHGPSLGHFRPSVGSMVRFAVVLFLTVTAIGLPLAMWKGQSFENVLRGLLVTALVFSVLPPLLALLVRPLGLTVYAEGLLGRTFWGRKRLLPWAEIGALRIDNSSGLTFVLIEAREEGLALWTLPGVLEDPAFQRLALELAGSDNPVVAASGDPVVAGWA